MYPTKSRTRVILCIAMLFSNLVYLALAFFLESQRRVQLSESFVQLRIPLTIVAGIVLAAGALLSLRLRPDQPAPAFQTTMLLSLALMEACTILGLLLFFLGLLAREFAVFAGVALAAQALLVLPKALATRDGRG